MSVGAWARVVWGFGKLGSFCGRWGKKTWKFWITSPSVQQVALKFQKECDLYYCKSSKTDVAERGYDLQRGIELANRTRCS